MTDGYRVKGQGHASTPITGPFRTAGDAGVTAALLGIAVFTLTDMVHAEDAFRMLKGREIGAKLTGMELTDDVHWALVFGRGGSLTSSMGRKTTGRWKVQQDQLCLDEADEAPRCYAVWHLGKPSSYASPALTLR